MALPKFEYHAPIDAASACKLLNDLESAQLLAGGTWVLNQLKKTANIKNFIGIKALSDLKGIDVKDGHLSIGAAETLDDISRNGAVTEYAPMLQKAINKLATPQIRNMATIGGNICSCLPWADLPAALLAMGAQFLFLEQGKVSCAQFLTAPKKYCAKDILTAIVLPAQKPIKYKYLRLPLRNQTDIPFGSLCFNETKQSKVLTANMGNSYPVVFIKTAELLNDKNKAYEAFVIELTVHQKDELRCRIMVGMFKEFIADL